MATQFEKFISTMEKVLMLDQADLDFGIYRIMNQKRAQIEEYLHKDLRKQVAEAISENAFTDAVALKKELAQQVSTLTTAGVNPDDSPKVKELKERIAQSGNSEELENEVYSHLTIFFSRYYDKGDFISQRRYKKDVYAIPYEGEEVKLYWANADQYYIKTGEYFRKYRFSIGDDKYCEFTLREASTEQNNNVAQNNMERRFALYEETPVEVIGNTLHIYFTYELYPKSTKQKTLVDKAFSIVKYLIPTEFISVLALRPTESDRSRTLLQKHLNDYVARNTFDYFIHKDLGGFLSRELDFYIKNEILVIDDIDARTPDEFLKHLTVIKAIKMVGMKLITFLASLENYQKRLWLKKKFVVESNYCITLDRVPESLYTEIAANDAQREEWVRLFAIDEIKPNLQHTTAYSNPLTIDFLKENPFLVLDTKFFTTDFKHKLLAAIDNIDEQCDGLLINSENFQALNFISDKFIHKINYIYIDPPYNTDSAPILYKNGYKDSSWNSLIKDRINIANKLIKNTATITVAIDHAELYNLGKILDDIYGVENRIAIVAVQHNPKGRNQAVFFSENIEYMLEYAININQAEYNNVAISDDVLNTFTESDEHGKYRWENFVRARNNRKKELRPDNWYPLYVSEDLSVIQSAKFPASIEVWPKVSSGEFTWKNIKETFDELNQKHYFKAIKDGNLIQIYHKYYENEVLKNIWIDKKYQSEFNGTNLLKSMFGQCDLFSFPKSIFAVQDSIKIAAHKNDIILDYFAGSGTTAHAVINLNRENGGNRKYILCEMGEYFDTVTKPRIQKVIYSKDWKDGKPVSREGSSHCFKYIRLEQYEDTLNNLTLQPANINKENVGFYGGYILGYMLDIETRDSLFNMKWFRNPWDMKLRITRQNETREENIDVIETFNYLIGMNVRSITYPKKDICTVEGVTRRGESTLVIWRNCDTIDNKALDEFFNRMAYSTRDTEFDRIYVNGDNNLENLRTDEEQWKVVLTEQEFAKRMFEEN